MVAHREALVHGQTIITELIQAVLREAKLPLIIAKLEGDAVFLYAPLDPDHFEVAVQDALTKMDRFFAAFQQKQTELVESNVCSCGGCRNAERLRLKIILHIGTALVHRVGRFTELAGTDVILAHCLLKNSVIEEQYLLLTEAAHCASGLDPVHRHATGSESYAELGEIATHVYLPPLGLTPVDSSPHPNYATWLYKTKNLLRRIGQARLTHLGLRRPPIYRNLT